MKYLHLKTWSIFSASTSKCYHGCHFSWRRHANWWWRRSRAPPIISASHEHELVDPKNVPVRAMFNPRSHMPFRHPGSNKGRWCNPKLLRPGYTMRDYSGSSARVLRVGEISVISVCAASACCRFLRVAGISETLVCLLVAMVMTHVLRGVQLDNLWAGGWQ